MQMEPVLVLEALMESTVHCSGLGSLVSRLN
jgi:hypothetical protein